VTSPKVLYFAAEYPRATDTFIQREIAAIRAAGLLVESSAIRRPGEEHMVGDEQRTERDRTRYLLPPSLVGLIGSHGRLLARRPRGYARSIRLALQTKRNGLRGGLYQLFYFAEAGLLADRVRREGFDHLHAHLADVSTSVAMLAASLADVPFSFTLHGPGVFFDANVWRLDVKIERAAFVSCISWFARSQAQLLSSVESAEKLHVIHCGVDPSRYADRSLELAGGDREQEIRLVFVARLDHVKGVGELLEAVAALAPDHPGLRLDLAGDGPDRAAYEKLTRELGLEQLVTFHGYVNQAEVAELLATADVYVLPSFAEGVPVGLMEAQAGGLPVVATQVGGVSELVEDDVSGFVCRPGDRVQLADRIARLASDGHLRRRMGAAGRVRVVAEFDSAIEGRRLSRLFSTVGGDPRASRLRPTAVLGVRPDPK
jgi:colanic acid/amylovoran biosynthesis glycosyltransferase